MPVSLDEAERKTIRRALYHKHGNLAGAPRRLTVPRSTIPLQDLPARTGCRRQLADGAIRFYRLPAFRRPAEDIGSNTDRGCR